MNIYRPLFTILVLTVYRNSIVPSVVCSPLPNDPPLTSRGLSSVRFAKTVTNSPSYGTIPILRSERRRRNAIDPVMTLLSQAQTSVSQAITSYSQSGLCTPGYLCPTSPACNIRHQINELHWPQTNDIICNVSVTMTKIMTLTTQFGIERGLEVSNTIQSLKNSENRINEVIRKGPFQCSKPATPVMNISGIDSLRNRVFEQLTCVSSDVHLLTKSFLLDKINQLSESYRLTMSSFRKLVTSLCDSPLFDDCIQLDSQPFVEASGKVSIDSFWETASVVSCREIRSLVLMSKVVKRKGILENSESQTTGLIHDINKLVNHLNITHNMVWDNQPCVQQTLPVTSTLVDPLALTLTRPLKSLQMFLSNFNAKLQDYKTMYCQFTEKQKDKCM